MAGWSFYYIFSQSHRLPAEFDAGFCFHDGKNLESFAGVLIGLLKYSQLALLKTIIFLIPITLFQRNLSSFSVLFLSRYIDICMVNGFSQDWYLLVVFASFEQLEHSGVFHSSQHFFFLHSEVWAVTLTYEIFLQRKNSRFQKNVKNKVKTFPCLMSRWYTSNLSILVAPN